MTPDDLQQGNGAPSAITLDRHADGILSIRAAGCNVFGTEPVAQLAAALDAARKDPSARVLVLRAGAGSLAGGGRAAVDAALARDLYRSISTFPYPVVAALRGDATGAGFLLAALCDFLVCSETARYGYAGPDGASFQTAAEDRLLAERFGPVHAANLRQPRTGKALKEMGWSCPVLPDGQVDGHADRLAAQLAGKTPASLRLLKQHLGRGLAARADALAPVEAQDDGAQPTGGRIAAPGKHIQLDAGNGTTLVVRLRTKKRYDGRALAADLDAVFAQLEPASGYRAVVIASDYPGFLPAAQADPAADTVAALRDVFLRAPLPVVAVLNPASQAEAWLVAQFCDRVVYQDDGRYDAASLLHDDALSGLAACMFAWRLDANAARSVLLPSAVLTGAELRRHVGAPAVAPVHEAPARALALAGDWSAWPWAAVRAWKDGTNALLRAHVDALPAGTAAPVETAAAAAEGPIALASRVVSAIVHPGGIVEVTMHDHESKNMFSEELVRGMGEAFAHIDASDAYKAVVLTGYDTYFACGGTRAALEAIQQGRLKFTDDQTFRLALACRIPVIAAMQGHAIGAGLSMGLFADFPLLCEEGKYVSPYMGYGFTPGVGATLVLPDRMGHDLARDSLFTACESDGAELRERGLALPVHPRSEVRDVAMALANALARHPRASLVRMKDHLSRHLRDALDETCARELAMHEHTFVGQAETLDRIQAAFGSAPPDEPARPGGIVAADLADVVRTLKLLLARELHLEQDELDEHTQFTDLGLDSITGVTWIRKVNQQYDLALDATIVYGFPTLARLGAHVKEQVETRGTPTSVPDFAEIEAGKLGRGSAARDKQVTVALAPIAAVPAAALPDAPAAAVATIRRLLARELHLEETELDENTQLSDLGLDSITGVTWIRKVNEHFGLALDATIVYSHPTLAKLGRHVHETAADPDAAGGRPDFAELETRKLRAPQSAAQEAIVPPVAPARPEAPSVPVRELVSWRRQVPAAAPAAATPREGGVPEPIAVIGMAGQFPMAKNLDEYWRNIAAGRDCISEVPPQRWDVARWFQEGEPAEGKTNSKWLGQLEDYDLFDPLFFNVSPVEARAMDPQQRLFLQACWQGIEHAGYNPKALAGSRCGVFVGAAGNDYGLLSRKSQLSAHGFTGNASSILSARIAYFLDLQGPCMAIDTACSSSLVAIATACDSLVARTSDLALAGGVYVGAGPAMHIMTAQSGMLSADGKCHSFDHRANGFVPGEAVGVVLLKRLADAERDGDVIHAVIQGWGVNQDGRTNGITAPNPVSQARLMRDVYRRHGIDPAGIQLVEAHGTGTPLGDPIEVEGLKQAFRAHTSKTGYCALGSVKSNIGHCLTAAGVTSFIKVVLALRHKQLPPTIHFERLNPHIRLQDSPFHVNDRLRDWTLDGAARRQAAVSSFGYSGTNAHLVVAEYAARPCPQAAPVAPVALIPLSAKTEEQLRQRVRDLLAFIGDAGAACALADVAYTLQVGREAMEERLGFVAESTAQLAAQLQAWLDGREHGAQAFRGRVRASKESLNLISDDDELKRTIVDNWFAQHQFSKLLALWTKGLELDWSRFHREAGRRRVVLPTYPFARERYWIDDADGEPALLHPLVHRNTSTLSRQRYASVLSARLTQDDLLEMARAAVALASPERGGQAIALLEPAWGVPFAPQGGAEITIELYPQAADRVGFELASAAGMHCRGEARFVDRAAAADAGGALYFEEYWRDEAAAAGAAHGAHDRRTVIFGAAGSAGVPGATLVTDRATDIEAAIRQAASGQAQQVAVVHEWARGRGQDGVHLLFDLFRAVKACGALVSEVVLVGHYDPAQRDTAWDYAWIGFERSLKLVLPDLKVALLYTDGPAATQSQLLDAQHAGGVTWYCRGRRKVLAFRQVEAGARQPAPFKQGGAYLITGGCGALGMKFARHLAREYNAKLVLLGRRARSPDIDVQLDSLRQAGAAHVEYAAVDLGDAAQVGRWAGALRFPLSGVFHAAGVEAARPFCDKARREIDAVLLPKTSGTLLLDEALQGQSLDVVCYFSSSAAILGDFGACDYAIANRFQMAYGAWRRQQARLSGKTVVVNWPFWDKEPGQRGGMGADDPGQVAFYLKSSGQQALGTQDGIRICEDLMHAGRTQTLVMAGQPARVRQFLGRAYGAGAPRRPQAAALPAPLAAVAGGASIRERLRAELRTLVCASAGVDPDRLDDRTNLADVGFDSISLAGFAKRVSGHFSLEVTPALFFNHSTVEQLVDHFAQDHGGHFEALYGRDEGAPAPAIAPAVPHRTAAPVRFAPQPAHGQARTPDPRQEPIAIVGMSGRFPQAEDANALWDLLAEGRSGVTEVPASRWDWRDYFTAPGHIGNVISTNQGGFIGGVDEFDPLFFEISPAEAEEMDPAERLLLMEAYRAIEDARMSPGALRGSNVGVFVGMEESQYSLVADVQGVTTAGAAMISSRLSYFLDLHGPAIATNTACSSGLVALHQAAVSLRQGECDAALVAAVALNLSPKAWIRMSEARMLSPSGQCRSFSKDADGIGVGDAVVVLMLKPLSAALEAGDHVYGTIKASGINFDGKTNGVTAPNGRAQASLIERVYAGSGIDVRDVSHVVAHGTGTRLGDPVEINALNDAFRKLAAGPRESKCAITSCKSNLGHTMAASGLVSVVALLKGLEHGRIPASLHCEEENDYIDWANSDFYVNKATRAWHGADGKPRMGAVSAFGRSGTNAHVVIEEYVRPPATQRDDGTRSATVIIPLSAKGRDQLRQKVRDLLDAIRTRPLRLEDVAYTLQVAREPMEERAAFVAGSLDQLTRGLAAFLDGSPDGEAVFQGTADGRNEGLRVIQEDEDMQAAILNWVSGNKLHKLAALWTRGLEVDWRLLYAGRRMLPDRVALPSYPFARERYWIDGAAPADDPPRAAAALPQGGLAAIARILDQVDQGALAADEASVVLKKIAV
jgi:acyl transferase domain-containing protein/enoyl-CoA hydratase/carnithine racemase/acyl carrier protein